MKIEHAGHITTNRTGAVETGRTRVSQKDRNAKTHREKKTGHIRRQKKKAGTRKK
jgi:hypothetical protein